LPALFWLLYPRYRILFVLLSLLLALLLSLLLLVLFSLIALPASAPCVILRYLRCLHYLRCFAYTAQEFLLEKNLEGGIHLFIF
jgi:hypothetical protein